MLKDRNGPSKVLEQRNNIDATFLAVSTQLFSFHTSIMATQGTSPIVLTPAHKIKLYNQFYRVANTHPSVAAEFVELLRVWASEKLVPEYQATLDEEAIFHAVSRNFNCFSLVIEAMSTIFHNVNNQLAESPSTPKIVAPKHLLLSMFRKHIYENIQAIVLKRVSEVRRDNDSSRLSDLRPIVDIFMSVARSTTGTFDKQTSAIYQRDYVDRYLERMIADNRAAVEAKQADNIPAHVIAVWLNERADFEEKLLSELVQAELLVELVESSLRERIKKRFADDVVTGTRSPLGHDVQFRRPLPQQQRQRELDGRVLRRRGPSLRNLRKRREGPSSLRARVQQTFQQRHLMMVPQSATTATMTSASFFRHRRRITCPSR
jgi:hypothetical protein